MTETVIYFLIGFVACFILDWIMLRRFKKDYQQIADLKKALITNYFDHVVEIGRLRDDIHKLRNFLTAQAGEANKKVDWEPDDYKDLSDGTTGRIEKVFKENNFKDGSRAKHRRFDDDELSEVSHMLQDHELREYGG